MSHQKKFSIRFKIFIPSIIVIILSCASIGITSYNDMKKSMIAMGVEQAQMAAGVAIKAADGDYLATLTEGNTEDEAFLIQQEALDKERMECGIAYLYTLFTDGESVYYGIDTGGFNPSRILHKERI